MLDPAGPGALDAALLWWGIFGFFTVVYIGVVVAWLVALKKRSSPQPSTELLRTDTAPVRRWQQFMIIGGGILLPTVAMMALLIPGIPAGHRMAGTHIPDDDALIIEVTGHQWWWEVHYPFLDHAPAEPYRDEIHIPANTPVRVNLRSADVIHSIWIPRLAPKVDLIPGRINQLFIQADTPGVYSGVCAEFCGLAHAHMTLELHAHSQQDFQAWLQTQNTANEAAP